MRRLSFSLIAFLLALSCFGQEVKIGETLPLWQEGELDIHFISTGHGECTFLIFPDGTTFLVDASGYIAKQMEGFGVAEWKPNDTVSPGKTIANYIAHFSPEVSKGHINYFLLTHHHQDHMGDVLWDTPWHKSNLFKLSSLCEIGSLLVMDNIFDRDYPDFSYPKNETGWEVMSNYLEFLKWTKRKNKSNIEKWAVGSCTQVVPLHDKSYDFTIRNLAGNGCCWTGKEDNEYVSLMPPKAVLDITKKEGYPDENRFSCVFMLSYGKFDYFTGGDLLHWLYWDYPYLDVESPLINVTHKVEVMKANHHGVGGSNIEGFINNLAPDVWLVGTYTHIRQPEGGPMKRTLNANPNCQVFSTYQSEDNIKKLVGELGEDVVERSLVGRYGHIVVRVAPGGDSYMIYTLEDSNEEYMVKSIHGPYICTDYE